MLSLWILSFFISFCAGRSKNEVSLSQNDAESILGMASTARENLILRLSAGQPSNTTCSCVQGIRTLRVDLFGIADEITRDSTQGSTCGESLRNQVKAAIEDHGGTDFSKISKAHPNILIRNIKKGKLKVTKNLVIGLLHNSHYQAPTPDLITLLDTVSEEIKAPEVKVRNIEIRGNNNLEDILLGIIYENKLGPSSINQVLHLVSAMANVRQATPSHPLLLMRPDEYPKDVILARDELLEAIDTGCLNVTVPNGWESQSDELLAMLTKLLQTPYSDPLAVPIHVVYSHYRLHYLACHGYTFHPDDISDIAFLLNSFLTIRSHALIQATFAEFSRADVPWHKLLALMDYSQYSSPRTMFLGMLRTILDHPESLKLCNTILFKYFINADANTTPDWLSDVFVDAKQEPEPIDLSKEVSRIVSDIGHSMESECPNQEISIIDPEALIEIIGANYQFDNIFDLVRYNPVRAEDFPQKTRVSALRAILVHIRNKKYKDEVSNYVISQAIKRMPINEKGNWPVELINVCPDDLEAMVSKAPTAIVPSENETPSEPEKQCKTVTVINQETLLDITPERHGKTIKELVYLAPILYKDYSSGTRKEILVKVLIDRQKKINDDPLQFVVPQDFTRLSVTWAGSLPPAIDETCEEDLKYNVVFPTNTISDSNKHPEETKNHQEPCTDVLTINPSSLIEILPENKQLKSIEQILLLRPILAADYEKLSTRSAVLKAVVLERSEDINNNETIHDAQQVVGRIVLKPKATSPITYLELCPKPKKMKTANPSLANFFDGLVDGLGESTIPCDLPKGTTTSMPETADSQKCPDRQISTVIVKTDSLWDALSETAPAAPHIRAKVNSYIVPIENNTQVAKGEILKQVLESVKKEMKDTRTLLVIEQMMKCIHMEGPALELPEVTEVCLPEDVLEEALSNTENPNCDPDEILAAVVKIESLFDAFLPSAPKTPFIREKMKLYTIPLDIERKAYTKAGVLEDLLQSIEKDVSDPRVAKNINILLHSIRKDGPGLEQPETIEMCLPEGSDITSAESFSTAEPTTTTPEATTEAIPLATTAASYEQSTMEISTTEYSTTEDQTTCEPDETATEDTTTTEMPTTEYSTTEDQTTCEPDDTTIEETTTTEMPTTTSTAEPTTTTTEPTTTTTEPTTTTTEPTTTTTEPTTTTTEPTTTTTEPTTTTTEPTTTTTEIEITTTTEPATTTTTTESTEATSADLMNQSNSASASASASSNNSGCDGLTEECDNSTPVENDTGSTASETLTTVREPESSATEKSTTSKDEPSTTRQKEDSTTEEPGTTEEPTTEAATISKQSTTIGLAATTNKDEPTTTHEPQQTTELATNGEQITTIGLIETTAKDESSPIRQTQHSTTEEQQITTEPTTIRTSYEQLTTNGSSETAKDEPQIATTEEIPSTASIEPQKVPTDNADANSSTFDSTSTLSTSSVVVPTTEEASTEGCDDSNEESMAANEMTTTNAEAQTSTDGSTIKNQEPEPEVTTATMTQESGNERIAESTTNVTLDNESETNTTGESPTGVLSPQNPSIAGATTSGVNEDQDKPAGATISTSNSPDAAAAEEQTKNPTAKEANEPAMSTAESPLPSKNSNEENPETVPTIINSSADRITTEEPKTTIKEESLSDVTVEATNEPTTPTSPSLLPTENLSKIPQENILAGINSSADMSKTEEPSTTNKDKPTTAPEDLAAANTNEPSTSPSPGPLPSSISSSASSIYDATDSPTAGVGDQETITNKETKTTAEPDALLLPLSKSSSDVSDSAKMSTAEETITTEPTSSFGADKLSSSSSSSTDGDSDSTITSKTETSTPAELAPITANDPTTSIVTSTAWEPNAPTTENSSDADSSTSRSIPDVFSDFPTTGQPETTTHVEPALTMDHLTNTNTDEPAISSAPTLKENPSEPSPSTSSSLDDFDSTKISELDRAINEEPTAVNESVISSAHESRNPSHLPDFSQLPVNEAPSEAPLTLGSGSSDGVPDPANITEDECEESSEEIPTISTEANEGTATEAAITTRGTQEFTTTAEYPHEGEIITTEGTSTIVANEPENTRTNRPSVEAQSAGESQIDGGNSVDPGSLYLTTTTFETRTGKAEESEATTTTAPTTTQEQETITTATPEATKTNHETGDAKAENLFTSSAATANELGPSQTTESELASKERSSDLGTTEECDDYSDTVGDEGQMNVTLNWPLLLKLQSDKVCVDKRGATANCVQVVNITDLLQGAEGAEEDLYITAVQLASVETYVKIINFDLLAPQTKKEFLETLASHLNITLHVKQHGTDPVDVLSICNGRLTKAMSFIVARDKRGLIIKKDKNSNETLKEAVRITNFILQPDVKNN